LAGVRLRAKETEISTALWVLEARERTLTLLYFTLLYFTLDSAAVLNVDIDI